MGSSHKYKLKKILILFLDYITLIKNAKIQKAAGVAIVKLDNIGDLLIWLHYAQEIRTHYNNDKITIIANAIWSEFANTLGLFDEIITIDSKKYTDSVIYHLKKISELKKKKYKIILNPVSSRFFSISDSIVHVLKGQEKIGYKGDFSNITKKQAKISDNWYKCLLPRNYEHTHEIYQHREFNRFIGIKQSTINLTTLLKSEQIENEEYFVICPGSSWEGRNWGTHKFIELCNFLLEQTKYDIYICGGKSELEISIQIDRSIKNKRINNLIDKQNLNQLIETIRRCKTIITNESAPAHIGTILGKDTLVITGGGHFGRFVPYPEELNINNLEIVNRELPCYGCNWKCVHTRNEGESVLCIKEITTSEVLRLLNQKILINHTNRQARC